MNSGNGVAVAATKFVSLIPNNGSDRALRGRGTNTDRVAMALMSQNATFIFHLLCSWVGGAPLALSDTEWSDLAEKIIPREEKHLWRVVSDVKKFTPLTAVDDVVFIDGAVPDHLRRMSGPDLAVFSVPMQLPFPPPLFGPALPLASRLV